MVSQPPAESQSDVFEEIDTDIIRIFNIILLVAMTTRLFYGPSKSALPLNLILLPVSVVQILCDHTRSSLLAALRTDEKHLPDAFRVRRYGRFGNNVFQLLQTLYISKVLGIRRVYLEPGFLFITNNTMTSDGVAIILGSRSTDRRVYTHSFYHALIATAYRPEENYVIAATFRDVILRNLQHPSPCPSSLFAHVRSGDVFRPNGIPPPKYGQPPCRYDTQAVNLDNTTNVSLIAQDTRNPCVKMLLNYTGATWRARDIRTDIAELIYARKMILARGTFGRAILFLSPVRKAIFYSMSLSDPGFGSHFSCLPGQAYKERVLDRWKNLPWQVQMMIEEQYVKWNWISR
jgi:hypothetical protein